MSSHGVEGLGDAVDSARGWTRLTLTSGSVGLALLLLAGQCLRHVEHSRGDTGTWIAVATGFAFWLGLPICALGGLAAALFAFTRAFLSLWNPGGAREGLRLARAGVWNVCVGLLPLGAFFLGHELQLTDRVFLAQHLDELEVAVRHGADVEDRYYDLWREGHATVIVVGPAGLDAYWIVHDPCGELGRAHRIPADHRLEHVRGPWYAMIH